MTPKEAKELSLEVWRYLAGHPEIEGKKELPKKLWGKIKNLQNECPLCEIYVFRCGYCPLDRCCSGSKLYTYWYRATKQEQRQAAAQKIVNAIEAWEPE